MTAAQQHDDHVTRAKKLFRDCGLNISAMRYPKEPEALAALRAFNGAPDRWIEPVPWRYHPNEYLARRWREKGIL